MATASTSANDLTRQQLDELDSLLQRMLSQPGSQSETPPPSAIAPPLPTFSSGSVSAEPEPRQHAPLPAPRLFAPPIEEQPAPLAVAVAPVGPSTAVAEREPVLPLAFELPGETIPVVSEPVPLMIAPFVAFNGMLNAFLGVFGLPGRVLRSGVVKNLIGLAGIGVLAYTGAKVAEVNGWIALPFELPWPR
jgi:hypothetical protein